MTQLRCDPMSVRNEFDRILAGVGARGSSFSDLDAISHDGPSHRFLVQEFKREGELSRPAQRVLLSDLARESRFTVWYAMLLRDGRIKWADFLKPESLDVITADEYRERARMWWANRYRLDRYVELNDEIILRK